MARHTSLYQSPRSPLIQGRTRWERPLWQAWLAGAVLAFAVAAGLLVAATRSVHGTVAGLDATAIGVVAAAIVIGSALGAVLARLFGWRQRWVGAVLVGLVALALVWVVLALLNMPFLTTIELVR